MPSAKRVFLDYIRHPQPHALPQAACVTLHCMLCLNRMRHLPRLRARNGLFFQRLRRRLRVHLQLERLVSGKEVNHLANDPQITSRRTIPPEPLCRWLTNVELACEEVRKLALEVTSVSVDWRYLSRWFRLGGEPISWFSGMEDI